MIGGLDPRGPFGAPFITNANANASANVISILNYKMDKGKLYDKEHHKVRIKKRTHNCSVRRIG